MELSLTLFPLEKKICVAGTFSTEAKQKSHHIVDFKHTFARVPTFSAAIGGFGVASLYGSADAPYRLKSVTNSTAEMTVWMTNGRIRYLTVAWMACL